MAISNEQLEKLKKSQAIDKSHCERIGGEPAHPIDFELLEQYQEKQLKVELDKQSIEELKKQIDNELKDLFK